MSDPYESDSSLQSAHESLRPRDHIQLITSDKSEPRRNPGLSNPAEMDKIDKLRGLGIGGFFALPQLVVVGDQSSGKSSVLEAIMEFPLPRDQGLCTRFATNIIFRRSRVESLSISIQPSSRCPPERAEALLKFKRDELEHLDDKTFISIIMEASRVMGITMGGEELLECMRTFSEDALKIELSGPDRENLSIIDIPGIFHIPTAGVTKTEDIRLVNNMVREYIKDERTIILAVIPANVDVVTREILGFASEVDPKGQRTLSVIAKPDLVDKGTEEFSVMDLVAGRRNPLALGYVVVRNSGQAELNSLPKIRAQRERRFFESEPWRTLLVGHSRRFGIDSLKSRLQQLLSGIIEAEFPKIKDQIECRLSEARRSLDSIGAERHTKDQQRIFLANIADNFKSIKNDAMDRLYFRHTILTENPTLRLPTLVADACDVFLDDIERNGHTIQFDEAEDSEASVDAESNDPDVEVDEESEDSVVEEEVKFLYAKVPKEPNADGLDRDISETKWFGNFSKLQNVVTEHQKCEAPTERSLKEWISNNYSGARGYELTLSDPGVLPLLWRGQSQKWDKVAEGFLKSVILSVHRFIYNLLGHVCPDHRIRSKLFEFIHDQILSKYKQAAREVEFLLKVERFGKMITKGGYFTHTPKNAQSQNKKGTMQMPASNLPSKRANASDPLAKVAEVRKAQTSELKYGQEVESLHKALMDYYKVARTRFVDNVIQSVDCFLLSGDESPLHVLTPMFISSMTEDQLKQIAGEDMVTSSRRHQLTMEISKLEAGRQVVKL